MSLCNACNVRLMDEESLKQHYKSDWHTLNAGRRSRDLPPVAEDTFHRYTAQVAKEKEEAAAADVACIYICDACNKKFSSEGQFETHIRTKKHVIRVKELLAEKSKAAATTSVESQAADAEETHGAAESKTGPEVEGSLKEDSDNDEDALVVSSLNCLFCFKESANIIENFYHMRETHSFFIPDFEHLKDPEGLAEHLLAKIIDGRCLYCTTTSCFDSPQAAQQHMIAKAHCRMRYDTPDDFEEFSDYFEYDEDDIPEDDIDPAYEGCLVVSTPGGAAVVTETDDLLLPSGKRLISRRLIRYYRQYFREPNPIITRQLERLALSYEEAGIVSMSSLALASRSTNLGCGTRGNLTDMRAQREDAQYKRRFELQTGLGMNQIRRKYFRLQMRE